MYVLYLWIIIVISVDNSHQTLYFYCESCASVPRFRSQVTFSAASWVIETQSPGVFQFGSPTPFFFWFCKGNPIRSPSLSRDQRGHFPGSGAGVPPHHEHWLALGKDSDLATWQHPQEWEIQEQTLVSIDMNLLVIISLNPNPASWLLGALC